RFRIRLMSWEYWPVYVFNIPVIGIWLWNALRSRDLFYFTLTNPGIETGGFFGEPKSPILHHIPDQYKPKTLLVKADWSSPEIEKQFANSGLQFPVIVKPEVGERGWLIKRINDMTELITYLRDHPVDMLVQTYVDLPIELSIMLYATPDGKEARVTSICQKHFLQVEGDGRSTLGELILKQDRAVLHLEKLKNKFGDRWTSIIPAGEIIILEHVGNHCRGTMFLNRNEEIDEAIHQVMIPILKTMPEVYYGRFDMRIESWEAFRKGEQIRVLEFNGTSSDPAHIYQPGYALWTAYRDMAYHWRIMRKIALQNRRRGHMPARFKKIISLLILYFRYKRNH
ncbi:MAG TPA: hypothetical protein VJ508_12705, partial [Saprospiraceae bacterium]|nr:hypothetical protein [Saprospiraceae bacterium]